MTFLLPTSWLFDAARVVGVDIGGTQCSVNLGVCHDGRFELLSRDQFATRSARGPDAILTEIEQRVRPLLDDAAPPSLLGISCGGPLDATRGVVQSPPNLPGWDDVPITSRLRQAVGMECVLENDANASALAEWAFGAGRGVKNLLYLTFGTGLGAGLFLDGSLYRGAAQLAGEVGHWRLGPAEGPVHYGKQGTFEGYCSGSGIVEWYRYLGGGDGPGLSAEVIAHRARSGEALAARVYDLAARRLGQGLAFLVDALAPDVIVIGGIYSYATDLLEPGMRAELSVEAHPRIAAACRVLPAQLGRQVGSYASCCVALAQLAHSPAAAESQATLLVEQKDSLHAPR